MSCRIPADLFVSIVKPDIDCDDESSVAVVAERAQIHYDTLRKILKGERQTIDLYAADRILCALGKTYLWWQEPLSLHYFDGAPVPPDQSKPIKCENPRCDQWFGIEDDPHPFNDKSGIAQSVRGRHKRRFCSDRCEQMKWRIDHGRAPASEGEHVEFTCEFCNKSFAVPRVYGGGAAQRTRRRACSDPKCKRALRADNMRALRARQAQAAQ